MEQEYDIHERIAAGGQGTVFLATNSIGKQYALKKVGDKEEAQREAKALMKAGGHPNVVGVQGINVINGDAYVVMDYVDGTPLDQYLDRHDWHDWTVKAWWSRILLPLLRGVSHIHSNGLIHRDLKPNNVIMVSEQGPQEPVIVDLGLAKRTQSDKTRLVGGAPRYVPPEWAEIQLIKPAYDIFQLALISYEVLYGDDNYNDITDKWDLDHVRAELEKHGTSFSKALRSALDDDAELRPQSCFEWIAQMVGHENETPDLHTRQEDTSSASFPSCSDDRSDDSYSVRSRVREVSVPAPKNTGDVTVSSLCQEIQKDYGLPDDSLVVLDGNEVVAGQTLLKNYRDAVAPKWSGGWFSEDRKQPVYPPDLDDLSSDVLDRYGVTVGFLKPGPGPKQSRIAGKKMHIANFLKRFPDRRRADPAGR